MGAFTGLGKHSESCFTVIRRRGSAHHHNSPPAGKHLCSAPPRRSIAPFRHPRWLENTPAPDATLRVATRLGQPSRTDGRTPRKSEFHPIDASCPVRAKLTLGSQAPRTVAELRVGRASTFGIPKNRLRCCDSGSMSGCANDQAHLPGPLQELDVARDRCRGPGQVQRLVRRRSQSVSHG